MRAHRPRRPSEGGLSEDRAAIAAAEVTESELGPARRALLELLGPSPTPVDDLMRRCHLSPSAVIVVLLELELAGRVETLPGNRVSLLPGM